MCGIAGILNYLPLTKNIEPVIKQMGECIKHRGPDDESYYFDENVAVAFRRLSIIDVEGGRQPVFNETKDLVCFMNGEIVNYVELREDLKKKGHTFSSNSDTEVLPHLYEEYAEDFVNYLVGMYAILLWDKKNNLLIIVRDRFGIKPLFYTLIKDSVIFASEIKSILATEFIKREVNTLARDMAFHTHFILPPYTMFKNILALEPGYILIIKNKSVTKKRYYHLAQEIQKNNSQNISEIENKIYENISSIMKMWMRSDVPLGISQSGGIDSSVLMHHAQFYADKVYSITVDFQVEKYHPDEVRFAKIMSKKINADHKIITVGSSGLLDCLPSAIWAADNINLAPAYINHFIVAREAAKYVKVLLTGAAGDELFMGYPWYVFKNIENIFYNLPAFLKKLFLFLFKPASVMNNKLSIIYDWLYSWSDFVNTYPKKHLYCTRLLYPNQVNKIFNNNYNGREAEIIYSSYLKEIFSGDVLNSLSYVDLFTLVAAHQMTQSDYAGMANSIENRPPFLDHRLVELMLDLPSKIKVSEHTEKKYLMKQTYKNYIPQEILQGKKVGFSSPLYMWVDDRFKKIAKIILNSSSPALVGCNKNYVKYFIENCDKNWKYAELVYGIIAYASWHKLHIEMQMQEMPKMSLEELWQ